MFDPARVTVGTTPTRLTPSGPGGSSGSAIAVEAPTGVDLYLGGPTVTTANGWLLRGGTREAYDLEQGEALYAVVASGTAVVPVLRTGV